MKYNLLLVAFGGSLGSISRYFINEFLFKKFVEPFPVGTLFVNAVGSFFMLFIFNIFSKTSVPEQLRLFFAVGFLGAFTTFSTYSYETLYLLRNKELILGLTNIFLNNIFSFVFGWIGIFLAEKMNLF